jgi:hypothetical protein
MIDVRTSKDRLLDEAVAKVRRLKDKHDGLVAVGFGYYELWDEEGGLKQSGAFANLITQVGDQYYGERAAMPSALPNQVSGMRLGTGGATAVAKTGAGAAIVTYTTASNAAIGGGFPTSALSGSSRRIQWKSSWAAGVATANGINEWVITNETPLTNVAGTAANTISRAVDTGSPVNKGASDTLDITWNHDLLGA